MLYSGIALGFVGGFLGIAIGVAALVGAILGRTLGGDISMSAAVLALAVSLVALAGAINMRRHWRAGVLLDAACAVLDTRHCRNTTLRPRLRWFCPRNFVRGGRLDTAPRGRSGEARCESGAQTVRSDRRAGYEAGHACKL